jgi:hypothetical protein
MPEEVSQACYRVAGKPKAQGDLYPPNQEAERLAVGLPGGVPDIEI